MSGPLDVLLRPFAVRREEAASAGLLAAYFFLAMSCVTTIKALQFSSFLKDVGVGWKLPVVYLMSAVVCVPIVLLFRVLARRYSHVGVASVTLLFFFVTLVAAHVGRPATPRLWFSFAFFLWSSIFCLLLPTLGWIISYDLYTTREGKRVFGLFGMGGIVGGASGAFWTYLFAERLGNAGLAIQTLFLLIVLQGILALIYQSNRTRFTLHGAKSQASYRGSGLGLRAARPGSAYLRNIGSLVLVSAAVSTLIDLQYLWFLDQRFSAPGVTVLRSSAEEVATFLGGLLAVMYVISGVIQVSTTGPLLRRFGVQAALILLPLTLLVGAGVAFVAAAFWAAVGLRAADGSLKSSVQRTALEILYVPQAGPRTASFRSFIDLVVNRTGDSAGAVFFLLALQLPSPARVMPLVLVGLTAVALLLAVRLGKGYLENLRGSLQRSGLERRQDLQEASVNPETTLANLQSSDRLRLRLAMEQLAGHPGAQRETVVAPIGEEMLETHISGLYRRPPSWLDSVVSLTRHPDPHTAAAAFHVLVREDPVTYMRELRQALASDSLPQMVHLAYLETYFDRPETLVRPPQMLGWCQHVPPAGQAILARIMGRTQDRAYLPVLRQWLLSDDAELRRGAIEALGRFAEPRFWNILVGFLVDSKTRQAARRALACYGDQAVENLLNLLHDPEADIRVKQEIPLVLGRIKSSSARSALLIALYWPDAVVSFRALKMFNKTRASHDLSYSEASFLPVLMQWARQYYQTANLFTVARRKQSAAWKLLRKAAEERCSWSVEKIFRTLELFLPRGDAYLSYLAIQGDRKQLRDNAIELIELRLKGEIKQALLPIFAVNETREDEAIAIGRDLFALPSGTPEVLRDGLFFSDSLVQCCIMAVIREEGLVQLKEGVEHVADSAHPLVRETARWALQSLSS